MICRHCGAENPTDTDLCQECGVDLDQGAFGFVDVLVYSTSKTLRSLIKLPDWIVKCLFIVATLCFAIGLAVAIWTVTTISPYADYSNSELAEKFLLPFLSGVFASGLVAGFALLLASLKRNADQIVETLVVALYVEAVVCYLIGMVHAILMVQNLPHSVFSNPDKAMYFLANFLEHGILYGAVLFGIAALISRREDSVGSRWPAGKMLYAIAAIVFFMSIAVASLQVNRIVSEGDQSWVDLAITFPYTLMSMGMLYGGIIAGIGGMVLYSSPVNSKYYCTDCGKDIFREWKLCPYCGSELYEVDSIVEQV
jgi:RNA polymerase subunit RPABC4/transcription elongation factor Spt4